jgi:hypothetical protein
VNVCPLFEPVIIDLNPMVWIHHDRGISNVQVYPREVSENAATANPQLFGGYSAVKKARRAIQKAAKKKKERTEEEKIIVLKVKATYVKKET